MWGQHVLLGLCFSEALSCTFDSDMWSSPCGTRGLVFEDSPPRSHRYWPEWINIFPSTPNSHIQYFFIGFWLTFANLNDNQHMLILKWSLYYLPRELWTRMTKMKLPKRFGIDIMSSIKLVQHLFTHLAYTSWQVLGTWRRMK